ncbi:hypothetical protein BCR43DRAFT_496769 [Syncephalastrum racemosum]|uniref:Uncharacterized protein n=1 Tax=Syncephalastrum racemosum TaxID=13706 RepID=A0A1X2H4L0_SYNRA|nr:hypothetical protein BCR43DRAFT_496769 [Syncephalastrum racemosum]
MQYSYILFAVAAVMAVNVSATRRHYHREQDCYVIDGNGNIGDTSGLLNNVLANGLLNDNSQKSSSYVVCDDKGEDFYDDID